MQWLTLGFPQTGRKPYFFRKGDRGRFILIVVLLKEAVLVFDSEKSVSDTSCRAESALLQSCWSVVGRDSFPPPFEKEDRGGFIRNCAEGAALHRLYIKAKDYTVFPRK